MMEVLILDIANIEWVYTGVSTNTIRLSVCGNELLEIGYEKGKFVIRSLEDEKINIRPVAVSMIEITPSKK